jgi:hypothetical protein
MTQSAASGDSGPPRPRVGELLVAMGALTEERLREALVQQQESGRPLGQLLVEDGYVMAHEVAMALADQHGGLLQTEYGFATGHSDPLPVRPIEADGEPPLRVAAPPPAPAPAPAAVAPAAPVVVAPPAPAPAPEPAPALPPAAVELPPAAPVALPPPPVALPPADAGSDGLEPLRAELADVRDMLADVGQMVIATQEMLAAQAAVAAALQEQVEAVKAKLDAPAAPPWPVDHHALFFRAGDRYRFVERAGAPPEPGSTVEVDGVPYDVLRLGPSAAPGPAIACAYLEPVAHSEWAV